MRPVTAHPWLPEFHALLSPLRKAAGSRTAEDEAWRPELEATGLFEPLSAATAEYVHTIDGDDLVALVQLVGWVANLPDDERADVLARVPGDRRRGDGAAPPLPDGGPVDAARLSRPRRGVR